MCMIYSGLLKMFSPLNTLYYQKIFITEAIKLFYDYSVYFHPFRYILGYFSSCI